MDHTEIPAESNYFPLFVFIHQLLNSVHSEIIWNPKLSPYSFPGIYSTRIRIKVILAHWCMVWIISYRSAKWASSHCKPLHLKSQHLSSLSCSFCHFPSLFLLLHVLSPILHFSSEASMSVLQSADAMEKRGEVNSLSPCFINNVTERLTEYFWMAVAGIKWLEYVFNHPH